MKLANPLVVPPVQSICGIVRASMHPVGEQPLTLSWKVGRPSQNAVSDIGPPYPQGLGWRVPNHPAAAHRASSVRKYIVLRETSN